MSLDHAIERLRNALQLHNENRTTMQSLASSVGDFLRDAATLCQQAGRVDEWMVERAREAYFNAANVKDGVFADPIAMRAALTAALAQNTQGDGEVTEDAIRQAQDVYEAACNEPSDYFGIEAVLKLHAERARVPEIDAEDWKVLQRLRDALPTVGLNGWLTGVRVLNKLLAAAPSQRAEVKP